MHCASGSGGLVSNRPAAPGHSAPAGRAMRPGRVAAASVRLHPLRQSVVRHAEAHDEWSRWPPRGPGIAQIFMAQGNAAMRRQDQDFVPPMAGDAARGAEPCANGRYMGV